MFCKHCGEKIDNDSRFCKFCSTEIIKEQPEEKKKEEQKESSQVKKNKFAVIGFVLGIISIFFSSIGVIPILASILSAIGFYEIDKGKGEGKTMAAIGLILGIIYTIVYLYTYGHI